MARRIGAGERVVQVASDLCVSEQSVRKWVRRWQIGGAIALLDFSSKPARLLNRTGVETGHANAWTQDRVRGFRNHHDIAVFRDSEWAERGEITLEAAAKLIGVCNMTALRMLRRGDIKGRQACAGAPWVIKAEDLAGLARGKRPLTQNATQQVFDFQ